MVKVHFRIYWTVCATMSRLPKHADAAQMPQLYSITKSRKLGLMQTGKSSSVAYTKKEHERRLTSVSTTTTLFMSANLLVPNGYCWLKICGTYCESSECISLLQSSNLSSVSQYFKATWDQPTRGKWIPHRIVWLKMSCRQHRRQEEWPSQSMCKNGCWLDNHCLLLTQELKSLLQNWPYFSPKRWQQLVSRFLMVLQWSSKLLWVQVHHHPSCVEAQETPSLKLHILGLFIIIIFPKPQGLSCRPLHNMGCWRGDDPTKASQVLKHLECKGENNFHLVIIWQSCHLPKTR